MTYIEFPESLNFLIFDLILTLSNRTSSACSTNKEDNARKDNVLIISSTTIFLFSKENLILVCGDDETKSHTAV